MIEERQLNVRIEIDGGIDRKNIEKVVAAGAEIIVAGSAIFGTPDAEAAVKSSRDDSMGLVIANANCRLPVLAEIGNWNRKSAIF